MPDTRHWCFGPFRLDPTTQSLWCDAVVLPLPPKPCAVLAYLVTHAGQVVAKETLLEAVWPTTAVTEGVLKTCLSQIRQVLGETARHPQYIATLHRRGYRFVAPVTVVDWPETPSPGAPLPRAGPAPHPQEALPPPAPPHRLPAARSQPGAVFSPAPIGERTRRPGPERAPLPGIPTALAEPIHTSRAVLEGERKHVTVLFADLTDSLALIHNLDPEAARQLLDPLLERMMAAVHRYAGTVNQVLGDGIMALFGAPMAHEDHAVRACYAALAMQTAVGRYAAEVRRAQGLTVQMRVGLNSGEVVVRSIGNDVHMDYSAIGQITHLAARMEQLARPGTTLLTRETLRLVEGLVQVTALGPVPIRGVPEPVEVFELVRASALRGRFQARVAGGLTRFVGRQHEWESLRRALAQAAAGAGQVVAAVGEAGVGKSRLLYEFLHSHHTHDWRVLESTSVSYGQAIPYCPVIDLLKRYTHVEEHDDAQTIRARVTGQVLALDACLQDILPALLSLLDALLEDSPFMQLDPPQRRQRTLDALKRLVLRESSGQPLVLVFEDLHWMDSETQALLDSLIDSLPTARMLLLVTYRPEYQHGWSSKTFYTQIRLDPLPPVRADELLQALIGTDPSLAPLTPLLIARTAGNPFFLEESVQTLVEAGIFVGEPGAYRLTQPLQSLQMPATVQAVLAARIDRLPPEDKRLLQTAAVIGHEVPFPLLQAMAELPEPELSRGLTHLQAVEFLYETRLFPERAYTFKHALTHEVAYGSLLQERRRALHARIVAALEALDGERVAEQVGRLAHHALRGEVWVKALAYCRQAGEKALARSAYREAMGFFEQVLSVLRHLPETHDTRELAIDLRLALCSALRPLGNFGPMLSYLREAESLAAALNDSRRLRWVSVLLTRQFFLMATYGQAIATAHRVLALATSNEDDALQARANQYLGMTYEAQGDYRRAIDCLRQTVASFDGTRRYERLGDTFVPAVFSRGFLARCHAALGMFAEGSFLGEEGLQMAEAVAHRGSFIWPYYGLGIVSLCQGDLRGAIPRLERAVGICHEEDLPAWFPRMEAALGEAYTLGGRVAEALPLLTRALEQSRTMGRAYFETICSLPLGEAHLLAGRLEEAQTLAERTLALARAHQERGHEAYALHLLGGIAAHREPLEVDEADARYRQALTLAKELDMRPLQAHCHRGRGMLYAAIGQREQARAALSTAINLYRAMEMTFWLPETEAALTQVAGR